MADHKIDPTTAWPVIHSAAIAATRDPIKVFFSPTHGHKYVIDRVDHEHIHVLRKDADTPGSKGVIKRKLVQQIVELLNLTPDGRLWCSAPPLNGRSELAARTMIAMLHPQLRIEKWKNENGRWVDHFVVIEEPKADVPTTAEVAVTQIGEAKLSPPLPVLLASSEGKHLLKVHFSRERDPRLVREKKRLAKGTHGGLACSVCGFDFEKAYGAIGCDFIECHHTEPLSDRLEATKTTLDQLALVCSNCHRMLHKGETLLTVDELRGRMSSELLQLIRSFFE